MILKKSSCVITKGKKGNKSHKKNVEKNINRNEYIKKYLGFIESHLSLPCL